MADLKIGDVVYLFKNQSTLYQISDIEIQNNKTYYWLKRDMDSPVAQRHHARFVHRATNEKDIEKYLYYHSPEFKAEMKKMFDEAAQWLKDRQEELEDLSFRVYVTDLWSEQMTLLEENGYFCYDLRDWDNGGGYNIEKCVFANRIGNWVTDVDLTPYLNEGSWMGIDELKLADLRELPYEEIAELLEKGEKAHFTKRNGGSLDDKISNLREEMEQEADNLPAARETLDKERDMTD